MPNPKHKHSRVPARYAANSQDKVGSPWIFALSAVSRVETASLYLHELRDLQGKGRYRCRGIVTTFFPGRDSDTIAHRDHGPTLCDRKAVQVLLEGDSTRSLHLSIGGH